MCSRNCIGHVLMVLGAIILLFLSISYIQNYTTVPDLIKKDIKLLYSGKLIGAWVLSLILFIIGFLFSKGYKEIKKEFKSNLWKIISSYFSEMIVIIYTALIGILFLYSDLHFLFKFVLLITSFILFYVTNKMKE